MLSTGDTAPDFVLPDAGGNTCRLADLADKWVVLWWYPKASTSG